MFSKFFLNKIIAITIDVPTDLQKAPTSLSDVIKNITNVLLWIVGVVAVIVLIIGGLMYITSAGDTEKTKRAKDAILYAVVGIVIAALAYAIVNFVIGRF